ncbi:MAG: L-histidine N(alpha)-methyltransferase [Ignavibacteria bacterium]|nr:L-histidine N(alpha)-methyltransferase [Ignavibacteria bacterium]
MISTKKIEAEDLLTQLIHGLKVVHKYFPHNLIDRDDGKITEKISFLDEYYITRAEVKILTEHINEITSFFSENSVLVEFSSGDYTRTRILLDHIPDLIAFIPVDLSEVRLMESAVNLKQEYPNIKINPVIGSLTEKFEMPETENQFEQKIIYLPSSKISSLTASELKNFVKNIAKTCGENGILLIGADLKKNKEIIESAYNDNKGLTEELNKNILNYLNEEFGQIFDAEKFGHFVFYNEKMSRAEMYLISKTNQLLHIFGNKIFLEKNEKILTQWFYKYNLSDIEDITYPYFEMNCVWTDPDNLYSLHLLKVKEI